MMMRPAASALFLAFVCLSCASTTTPTSTETAALSKSNATSDANSESPQPSASMPNIPKNARFTIFCQSISGPGHPARAAALRDQLVQVSRLRDWYIIQGERESTLYYGFYRCTHDPKDPKESERAQNDLKAIQLLTNKQTGSRLFSSALFGLLDSPDPSAPPEWNLANAKGYYSLQIAVYKDAPDRKESALQAVREARAVGHEAYYYHGPTSSSVCIGTWPITAINQENEFKAKDPNSVVLTTPGQIPLPEGVLMTQDGRPLDIRQAKITILDPKLKELMERFPIHSINGVEGYQVRDPRTGRVSTQRRPSFLVRIPQDQPNYRPMAGMPEIRSDQISVTPSQPIRPQAPTVATPVPKGGKLRSIDD